MEGETEEGGLGLLCLLSKGLRLVKLSVRLVGTINYKNANFNVNRTKYFDQLPKMNFGTCRSFPKGEESIVILYNEILNHEKQQNC